MSVGITMSSQPVAVTTTSPQMLSIARKQRLQDVFFHRVTQLFSCLLYTSDAADERSSVDLGGRRILKKKKQLKITQQTTQESYLKTTRQKKTLT